jgi:hypothetical protein
MRDRELFDAEISQLLPSPEGAESQGEIPEVVVTGATHYLPIALSKSTHKRIGAFVPTAARQSDVVDVIVYFHGHAIAACGTNTEKFRKGGMQYYWNTPLFTCLRRDLEASGKRAVLLAPAMHPFVGGNVGAAGYGNLGAANKFDELVSNSLSLLKTKGALPRGATVGNVILAGHSGGGQPMQAVMMARNTLKPKIRAAWGFETLYFGTAAITSWLKSDADLRYRHYRRAGWKAKRVEALQANPNYLDKATASSHCKAVQEFWSQALSHMPVSPGVSGVHYEYEAAPVSGAGKKLHAVELHKSAIAIARAGNKANGTLTWISEAPADFLPYIIQRAQAKAQAARDTAAANALDPQQFFRQFTRSTFLGRAFKAGQYIHVEMARKMQAIENALVSQVGGTAKSAGDTLLNHSTEGISGSRLVSSTATFSMHMFGVAVDVNYLGNPYIESGDIATLNAVLRNAATLFGSTHKPYTRADRYDAIARLDSLLERYFALQDDAAQLTALLAAAKVKPWMGKTLPQALAAVTADLRKLSAKLARGSAKSRAHFKAHALLDFDKRFVEGMERGGLHWGGEYGDIMHFDMRGSGVGRYIQDARLEYAGKAKALARKYFNQKSYGGHAMER